MKKNNNVKEQIVSDCAPVFMGVKTANAISIREKEKLELIELAGVYKVDCDFFYSDGFMSFVFLYQKTLLSEKLKNQDVYFFLKDYGYTKNELLFCLEHLRMRYQNFRIGNGDFPHEIGLFLDYPIRDIEEFIKNKGKNYLLCGYWKVYDDVEAAKMVFRNYDLAREHMLLETQSKGTFLHTFKED